MEARELLYEGKAKKVFSTDDPELVVVHFKDDATAFDGTKKEVLADKGELNAKISEIFFDHLGKAGVPHHWVRRLSDRDVLVKKLDIIPCETIVRNIVAGSLAKRLGLEEGTDVPFPLVEFYYKSDPLHDPMILDDHAVAFGWAKREELERMKELARRINDVVRELMRSKGILLVDAKFEFGRTASGEVILGDEICPDTCRFWDAETRKKLDKDRFRRDLGDVMGAYREILSRLSS